MVGKAIDRRLTLWLGSLAALAAFNVGLWVWIARSTSGHTPYFETQLLLSGVYVGVCGFRSPFPRSISSAGVCGTHGSLRSSSAGLDRQVRMDRDSDGNGFDARDLHVLRSAGSGRSARRAHLNM